MSSSTHPLTWIESGDGFSVSGFIPTTEGYYSSYTGIESVPGGFLAATSRSTVELWFSEDGSSWAPRDFIDLDRLTRPSAILSLDGKTYMVGSQPADENANEASLFPVIWRSDDLETWFEPHLETKGSGFVAGIVSTDSKLLAVGNDGDGAQIWRASDDGGTWQRSPSPEFDFSDNAWELTSIASANGIVIAVGEVPTSAYDREVLILQSNDDGETWVRRELDPQIAAGLDSAESVSAAGGAFWIISGRPPDMRKLPERCREDTLACDSDDTPVLLRSEDGQEWDEVDLTALEPEEFFEFDEVVEYRDGVSLLVAGNNLQLWSWPTLATPPLRSEWAPTTTPETGVVKSGAQLEFGVTYEFPLYIHCGMEVLGNFNGNWWYLDIASASKGDIDQSWPIDDQTILGMVTLIDVETIEYSLGSGEVIGIYRSLDREPPDCI